MARALIMRFKLLLLLVLLLAACSPYKMDIRQGNFITPEQREKLKVGMTRAQVRTLLGTPLISDPFHPDRWDYAYRLEHGMKLVDQQRMTLYFGGDNLTRIDDSRMPALPPAPVEAPAASTEKAQP
jgi:outer membrane protein assembly factor BamE